MGGHQTYPGQDIDVPIPRHVPTGSADPDEEYDHTFWSAAVVYMTFGVVNPPGGILTVPMTRWALARGMGQTGAVAFGLAGEWVTGILLIGILGAIFDPLDLYEGGLIPDAVAQNTTLPVWNFAIQLKDDVLSYGSAAPANFDMDRMGSFQ